MKLVPGLSVSPGLVESAAEVGVAGKTPFYERPDRRIAMYAYHALLGLPKVREREHCVLGVRTWQRKRREHSQPGPRHLQPLLPTSTTKVPMTWYYDRKLRMRLMPLVESTY